MTTQDTLTPRPEHRFTFGLWTVGNPGAAPFGGPTRPPLDSVDPVRRLAELGAEVYVFWGGREGTESGVAKDPRDALERYREAINVLGQYAVDQGYDLRFALEPKPNEPRGNIYLPTVGHALHFISTLDRPDMVGVNP